ncbi:hypothetical protein [Streptacidiphilus pinicola]|nr:hypothetical protein [Streptacidiphilus pinicola]
MTSLRSRLLCTAALAGTAAVGAVAPASADTLSAAQNLQKIGPTQAVTTGAMTGANALTGGIGMVPGALGMVPGAVGGLGMLP